MSFNKAVILQFYSSEKLDRFAPEPSYDFGITSGFRSQDDAFVIRPQSLGRLLRILYRDIAPPGRILDRLAQEGSRIGEDEADFLRDSLVVSRHFECRITERTAPYTGSGIVCLLEVEVGHLEEPPDSVERGQVFAES